MNSEQVTSNLNSYEIFENIFSTFLKDMVLTKKKRSGLTKFHISRETQRLDIIKKHQKI